MEPYPDMNNLLNGTATYSRLLEYNDHLISLSPYEICIANLGTYKKGANTSINPIRQPKIESVLNFEASFPYPIHCWLFLTKTVSPFSAFLLSESNKTAVTPYI